jgi:hypothetical protein
VIKVWSRIRGYREYLIFRRMETIEHHARELLDLLDSEDLLGAGRVVDSRSPSSCRTSRRGDGLSLCWVNCSIGTSPFACLARPSRQLGGGSVTVVNV